MNFLIADTFTDSLARLTGDEQKAVKTTPSISRWIYYTERQLLSVAPVRESA